MVSENGFSGEVMCKRHLGLPKFMGLCISHCRVQHREVFFIPLQATDLGGTITMVTGSGRSFTRQIKTEDTAVQETNPATPGELVLGN